MSGLRGNFAWTLAGNLVYMVCQGGMLVALAKLGSPEMVGQFALGLAVSAPFMVLSNLQLRAVQATDARAEFSFSSYYGLRVYMTVLAMAAILAVSASGAYPPQTGLTIALVGLSKAIESISDILFGWLQRNEQMRYIAQSLMLKGLLSLPALALAVWLSGSVAWGVAAMCAVWSGVLLFYERPVLARLGVALPGLHWEPETFRRLLLLSWPLGLVTLLLSLNANMPRYFVERFRGPAELGIFAALAYLPLAGMAVVNALGQSITPRLADYYAAGHVRAYTALLGKALATGIALGLAMTLAAWLGGARLLTLLYRPQYAAQERTFVWLMAAGAVGFVASFLGYGATAARYFRAQLPLFGAVALATAAGCLAWIPKYGGAGAAWAMLTGSAVQAILTAGVVGWAIRGRQ